MKKLSIGLCALLVSGSLAHAASGSPGTGHGFVGVNLGLGGWGYGSFGVGLGVLGGYHYYFPSNMQFGGFRHGVRGYGALDWAYYGWNFMFLRAGADWTIDFTPQSRYVWGAFAGFSLGGVLGYFNAFGWSFNVGGSFEMHNRHRFELALGWGYHVLSLRYIFKF